ncbi:hypothetical protein [Streptomyces sp. NPDC059909]|uniref:hypothetical protein n=1 Tax=Streptomyces sp. NPDC059909 TaxID=3346998 RepID=UPI003649A006
MISSFFRTTSALAAASLLLAACGGSTDDAPAAKPKPHPVFSLPVGEQPYQSVRQTQQAGSASFTQQLTFTSRQGDAVLTAAGRLDFTGGRADGTHTWEIPDGLPAKARDTLLGEVLGKGSAASSARIALAPETVQHRSGTADYWLRYDLSQPVDEDDSIAWLHGTEAPFGGTLLEVITSLHSIKGQPVSGGGRRYTAHIVPSGATENLFPGDLRRRLRTVVPSESAGTPVPMTLTTDAEGRITQAEADLSALLKAGDSGLPGVTALRARLVLTAHGRTKPVLPSASDAVLEAGKAVLTRHEATPGDCIDFNTGTRDASLVVEVSCTGPHDARVFGRVPLTSGDYPGPEAAHRRASDTCRRAHGRAPSAWTEDNAEPGKYWSSWPTASDWGDRRQRVATCYVVSR